MNNEEKGVIAQEFTRLKTLREPFLRRARACSVLTKPTVIPPDGHNGSTEFPIPYQTVGAEGVNNFASRLNTILFPVGSPWFRYVIADKVLLDAAKDKGGEEQIGKVRAALSEREQAIRRYCETINLRVTTGEACTHAIIGGNDLLYIPQEDEPLRCYGMDRYVLRRKPSGEVIQIIINEEILLSTQEDELLEYCGLLEDGQDNATKKSILYTSIDFDKATKRWLIKQELNGIVLPEDGIGEKKVGKWGKYPECPYIAVRWSQIDGESWGRGYVEDLLGGLITLDVLTRAVVEGAEIASLTVIGVRGNQSNTKKRDVQKAKNGDVITADFNNDISMLRADKGGDYNVAERVIAAHTESLQRAFLMHSAVQRKGERVTSYEIKAMIQALEQQIGNVYAIFASELQPRVIRLLEKRMIRLGKLDPLPDNLVETSIVTGLEALGRGQDLQKIMEFAEISTKMLGPEIFAQHVKPAVLMRDILTALQLESKDFVQSDEELAAKEAAAKQQMQEQQMLDMAGKVASPAAQLIGQAQQAQ